mgnify:FL=1
MPFVYRVEHEETHLGPYNTYGASDDRLRDDEELTHWWYEREHADASETPSPLDDFHGYATYEGKYFGFLSIQRIHDWFTENELFALLASGFVVARYEVSVENILHSITRKLLAFSRNKEVSRTRTVISFDDVFDFSRYSTNLFVNKRVVSREMFEAYGMAV